MVLTITACHSRFSTCASCSVVTVVAVVKRFDIAVPPGSPVVCCMTQNPAEHRSSQAGHQNRLTCGFVLFPSSANVEKTQYLFFTVTNTRKTRFPTSNAPQSSEEFLPGDGKIFTMAALS